MAQGKSRSSLSASSSHRSRGGAALKDPLLEIRAAVQEDRRKYARLPIAELELKAGSHTR